jgi:alpha-tubulin suppressor-like RCC1 family protein
LWGDRTADQTVDFDEVKTNVPLAWRERYSKMMSFRTTLNPNKLTRFVSISAGNDHLLALTSKGRTFVHPISRNANTHGQLGLHRMIHVLQPGLHPDKARVEVDLIPKSVKDPYALSSPAIRDQRQSKQQNVSPEDGTLSSIDDSDIRFCDTLYEMPSLAGVSIAQVVAGARTSFARTENGRVLGWGANEHR